MKKCPSCVKYFDDDTARLCQYCGSPLLDTQINPNAFADTVGKEANNEPPALDRVPSPSSTGFQKTQENHAPTLDERIVVDVTPEYLVGFFREHTTAQAKKLLEAYIGKWMKVSGVVQDVESNPNHYLVLFRPSSVNAPLIWAHFREQRWMERVLTLKLGDNLTAFGQITNADHLTLFMDNCEVVISHSTK
jgi:hypothetical protein